ncbi:hypothetical protein JXR93_09445 [bacterium]|nr:hypothetical protein [bacterium]
MKALFIILFFTIYSFNAFAAEDKETIKENITNDIKNNLQKDKEEKEKKKKKKKKTSENSSNTEDNKNTNNSNKSNVNNSSNKNNNTNNYNSNKNNNTNSQNNNSNGAKNINNSTMSENDVSAQNSYPPEKGSNEGASKTEYLWRLKGVLTDEGDIFSFKARYNFQYWEPTFIEGADIDTTTISYASFDLSLLKGFFQFRYETSFGGSSLADQQKLFKERSKKDSWEKLVANLEFPFSILSGYFKTRFYFSYTQEIFMGTVKANQDKTYISRDQNEDPFDFLAGEEISFSTKFQDFILGIRSQTKGLELINLGFFYTRYEKPYSLTMGDNQSSKYIFDSLFQGGGLFLAFADRFENFKYSLDVKFGMGSIYLRGIDLYVEDVLGQEDASIGYLDTKFNLTFFKSMYHNIVSFYLSTDFRYRKFFVMYESEVEVEDENGNVENEYETETIFLNSDFIVTIFAGFSILF